MGRKSEFWHRRRERIEGVSQRVQVSMSEAERAQLHLLEQRTGFSPSRILVSAALHGVSFSNAGAGVPGESLEERQARLVELLHLRRVIGGIANNFNQIARHANATGEIATELRSEVVKLREVYDMVTEVAQQNRMP